MKIFYDDSKWVRRTVCAHFIYDDGTDGDPAELLFTTLYWTNALDNLDRRDEGFNDE